MVAQDRSSIEDVWGNSTGTVLGNTATTRVFNIGRSDEGTAAWVATLMGDRTVVTQSKNSSSTQKSDREGESFNQNKDKLLSAVDIQESSHQTLLCFMRGHKPLLLKRLISHKHPLYKTKLDKNPVLIKKG
jgi:type IV secretion system protein VirD4